MMNVVDRVQWRHRTWGIFVVLSVQIYFLFHLAEFRKRDMSNVSVAWIGAYRS
jgi:hypothetical protein